MTSLFGFEIETHGLVVFVDAEKGNVQVIAGVGEVVGIASEEGSVELRRENQADVGVLLVFVEMEHFAGVERNHIAAHSGGSGAIFFNGAHGGALSLTGFCGRHSWVSARLHFGGDVLDFHQDIQLKIGTLRFVGLGPGVETGLHKVSAGFAELLNTVSSDVMIGERQTIGRHERSGTSIVKPHGRQADMIEPGLGGEKTIAGFDLLPGESIEQPHSERQHRH